MDVVGKIFKTNDLNIFKVNEINSDVKMTEVKNIKQSILKYGLTQPIRVDDEYVVRDGHHRLKAMQELVNEGYEIEAYYFFNINDGISERDDMLQTNTRCHKKGNNEMIQVYARSGDVSAKDIQDTAESLNISPSLFLKVATRTKIGDISKLLENGFNIENRDKIVSFFKWYNTIPKSKLGVSADIDVVILYKDFYCNSQFKTGIFDNGIEEMYQQYGYEKVFVKGDANQKRELFVKIYNGNRRKNIIDYTYDNKKNYTIEFK